MAVESEPETPPRIVAQLGAPSLRGVARLVAIIAVTAAGLYLLWLTRDVLKVLLIAVFTATALARWSTSRRRPGSRARGRLSASISRARARSPAPARSSPRASGRR